MNRIQGLSPVARAFRPVYTVCRFTGLKARATTLLLFAILAAVPDCALAEPQSNAKSWVIWPGGSLTFPTGRFGEKDEDLDPPKDGHKSGLGGSVEAGYFISDFVSVGLGYQFTRFDLDLAGAGGRDGNTSCRWVGAWGRLFLRGGYQRWQPYVFASAGIGRPKATIEYDPPVLFAGLPSTTEKIESTVDAASTVSAGIGVLIPATKSIALSIEPRYTSIGSKGTARTDLFNLSDGSQAEVKEDVEGNRLKAKSNTNWWEIRVGVVFLLRR